MTNCDVINEFEKYFYSGLAEIEKKKESGELDLHEYYNNPDFPKFMVEKYKLAKVSTENDILNAVVDNQFHFGIMPGFLASYAKHKIEDYLKTI